MDEFGFTEREAVSAYFPKKMTRAIDAIGDVILADYGIKTYHLSVLRTVYSNEGIDQKTIRTVVPFDKSRISVIVRELLEMGLLMDTASGRSSSLHLTAKGREVVSKTPQFKQRLREELFSPFSKEEMEEMRELFAKLNSHLDTVIQKYCGDNTD